MSDGKQVSEEMRNTFVDGQLDTPEWESVMARMDRDAALREDLCELRRLKDMVRHAYATPPVPRANPRRAARPGWIGAAAAGIALVLLGWFGNDWWAGTRAPVLDPASAYALRGDWHLLRDDWRSLQGNKILVHVSSGDREALATAIDEVEDLLRAARAAKRSIDVEVVANSSGLNLLSADDSLRSRRIVALRREFPNLGLVACGQTLERRRDSGQTLNLVTGAAIAPSALEQIVKRLREGWVYVRA